MFVSTATSGAKRSIGLELKGRELADEVARGGSYRNADNGAPMFPASATGRRTRAQDLGDPRGRRGLPVGARDGDPAVGAAASLSAIRHAISISDSTGTPRRARRDDHRMGRRDPRRDREPVRPLEKAVAGIDALGIDRRRRTARPARGGRDLRERHLRPVVGDRHFDAPSHESAPPARGRCARIPGPRPGPEVARAGAFRALIAASASRAPATAKRMRQDPEADDDAGLGPAGELEVVVQRRHPEDALARGLERSRPGGSPRAPPGRTGRPTITSSISCLIITATAPSAPPSGSDPTSPMKTSAGWELNQRKPSEAPTIAPQKTDELARLAARTGSAGSAPRPRFRVT